MENITNQALLTYQANLAYFEKNHPLLYEKLSLLDIAISNGYYQEKYALEYLAEGYFDIQELSSKEWLYGENSLTYSQKIVDNVNFKRTGGVFKAHKYVCATKEQTDFIDQSELSFHNALWATATLIHYASTYTSSETYMKKIHKIIFLDIGLGLHIDDILKKLNPQVIFIKEKNLEIFRLSLFVLNYSTLAQNYFTYFSIADDIIEERKNFTTFLDKGNNYNLTMKHIPFNKNYEPELRKLQGHVLSQSYISYGYSAVLLRFIDSPRYLVQNYSFLNVNKKHQNTFLDTTPVLLLFSGPSTSKNIDWIKKNHHRFIIITALSTCKLLYQHNVTPNVVIHIDPGAEATATLFESIDTKEYFKNTTILLASNVDEATVQRFNRSQIHFIEQGTLYKKGFGRLSAPSVGEYSYGLFLIFGAKRIFILGMDLALDSETLETHGGFHAFQTKGIIDDNNASLDPHKSVEFTPGNFLKQVPMLSTHKLSHIQFEVFTDTLKTSEISVYNLSNGAYLKGADPLHIEDYSWENLAPLDSVDTQEKLTHFFNSIGEANFNTEDRSQIKYQVSEAKKLEKIIKQFQKKKFTNAEAYLIALAQLAWDLSDMDYKRRSDLAQVYYEYFPIVLSYIFDLFNTKDLENPNKHVVQINAILMKQLLKISSLYITKLEAYLK